MHIYIYVYTYENYQRMTINAHMCYKIEFLVWFFYKYFKKNIFGMKKVWIQIRINSVRKGQILKWIYSSWQKKAEQK